MSLYIRLCVSIHYPSEWSCFIEIQRAFSGLVEEGVTPKAVLYELLVSLPSPHQVYMDTRGGQHTGSTSRSPNPLPVLIYITAGLKCIPRRVRVTAKSSASHAFSAQLSSNAFLQRVNMFRELACSTFFFFLERTTITRASQTQDTEIVPSVIASQHVNLMFPSLICTN